jgi:hypothetical protein
VPPGARTDGKLTLDQRKILARQREAAALSLRKAGVSYNQIATQLNIAPLYAYRVVQRALQRIVEDYRPDAERLIALELERLDAMTLPLWQLINNPKAEPELIQGAVDRVLKIMDRRAKLVGLDKLEPATPASQADKTARALSPTLKGATTEELLELRRIFEAVRARRASHVERAEPAGSGPGGDPAGR